MIVFTSMGVREGKDKGKTHVTVWQASRELVRLYFLSLVIRDTALILIFVFVITFRRYLKKEMATHSSILSWKISMDWGAWQATVHGVAKSQTQLSDFHLDIIYILVWYVSLPPHTATTYHSEFRIFKAWIRNYRVEVQPHRNKAMNPRKYN